MAILDKFIPVYYEILRMGAQHGEEGVAAVYDIALRNVAGNVVGTLSQGSVLTSQEREAIAAIFQRDKVAFENITGLTEWEG